MTGNDTTITAARDAEAAAKAAFKAALLNLDVFYANADAENAAAETAEAAYNAWSVTSAALMAATNNPDAYERTVRV